MLTPSDAELVRRDAALPGLALVLDPDALLETLHRRLPEIEGPVRYSYLRYKPGVSCLAGFQIEMEGQQVDFHARAHRRDAPEKLGRPTCPERSDFRRFIFSEQSTVVSAFPDDRRLASLVRLADPQSRGSFFQQLFPDRPEWAEATMERLRYKPERRYVARLLAGQSPVAVLKVHRQEAFSSADAAVKYLQSRGSLRLPARLGRSHRHGMLALEWLTGELLDELLFDPNFAHQTVTRVGAALAELHRQKCDRLKPLARQAETDALLKAVESVTVLCPQLASDARRLAIEAAARLSQLPSQHQVIHGDFYPKQILLDEQQVGLLDLDDAASGDPAVDLGNFCAHLWKNVICRGLSPDTANSAAGALAEGYGRSHHRDALRRMELYSAVGLLRLTPHPFRSRSADWPEQTEALLHQAEKLLHCGSVPDRPTRGKPLHNGTDICDPHELSKRPETSFLAEALDPPSVREHLTPLVAKLPGVDGPLVLRSIRVIRFKPRRRCLIEYQWQMGEAGRDNSLIVIGKVRLKGLDKEACPRLEHLWHGGFDGRSADGISVPLPVGMVPHWRMWLQQKVPGRPATELLADRGGVELARRIAEAIHKLHRTGPAARRRHTVADELCILREKLPMVAEQKPALRSRLLAILDACDSLAASLPTPSVFPIHRDFYPDHVLVQGDRLHLLDLDLYCEGDPALDVGNFCAHMKEHALRTLGCADALIDRERALQERYVELAGEQVRSSISSYVTLSLIRHIYLCGLFPTRRSFAERLVDLCESRLGLPG